MGKLVDTWKLLDVLARVLLVVTVLVLGVSACVAVFWIASEVVAAGGFSEWWRS